MATTTPNYGLRKPTNADTVNVATDISANMDLLDAHAHSGTYVALVAAPTGVAATDTATINAARTAAGVGGQLIFSAGTYLTTGLVASVASQRWQLAPGTTISMVAATVDNVLRITAAGVIIDGGTFDATGATGSGIVVTAVADCQVLRTTVLGTSSYGIYGRDCDRLLIDGNSVTGSGNIGIYVEATTAHTLDPVIRNNRVDRSSLGTGLTEGALKIHGTGTLKVQRAKIHDNRVFMPTSPVSSSCIGIEVFNGCPYASIRGNHTSGGYMGISVDRSDYAAVIGNVVYNASIYGIEIPTSNGVAISGNTVDGNGLTTRGIILDGSTPYSKFCSIVANTVQGCTPHGIHTTNAESLTVSANVVRHDTAGANNGIYIQGGKDVAIAGNTIDGGLVGGTGVQIENATDATISGNQFRDLTSIGVRLTATGGFTVNRVATVGNSMSGMGTGALQTTSTATGGSIGQNITQWSNTDNQYRFNNTNQRLLSLSGSPESVAGADVGSLALRYDGGVGTAAYVKHTGTGTTGWLAIPADIYKAGAGTIILADGDFPATPPDGSMGVAHNTTTGKSYWCARANGTWKAVEIS